MRSSTNWFVGLGILLSVASSVSEADPAPVDIHFSVIQQLPIIPLAGKTNITRTVTNVVFSGSETVSNYVIDDARLLAMLANSYNTNFPSNATIKMFGLGAIAVVAGTNLILDPGAVMSLYVIPGGPSIFSGPQGSVQTYSPKGYSSLLTEDQTSYFPASFVYDDSSLTTRDGTTTQFSANGIESFHNRSRDLNNAYKYTFHIKFTGSGVGTNFTSSSLNRLVIIGDLSAHISSSP